MSRDGVARVDFYFDDWLTGTFELAPELRGAFVTICALIWKTGDRLRDCDESMARWNGVSPRKWRALKAELVERRKILIDDGFIRQPRAQKELKSAEERRETARRKGAKGGAKKAETREFASFSTPESEAKNDEKNSELEANRLENLEPAPSSAKAEGVATNTNTYKSPTSSVETQETVPPTGGTAGPPEAPPERAKSVLWREMKAQIGGKDPGALVRKWLKAHGEPEVFAAHFAAMANVPEDYVSWMTARLKANARPYSARAAPVRGKKSYNDHLAEALSSDDDDAIEYEALPGLSRTPPLLC